LRVGVVGLGDAPGARADSQTSSAREIQVTRLACSSELGGQVMVSQVIVLDVCQFLNVTATDTVERRRSKSDLRRQSVISLSIL
jgi:hypothetical protein